MVKQTAPTKYVKHAKRPRSVLACCAATSEVRWDVGYACGGYEDGGDALGLGLISGRDRRWV